MTPASNLQIPELFLSTAQIPRQLYQPLEFNRPTDTVNVHGPGNLVTECKREAVRARRTRMPTGAATDGLPSGINLATRALAVLQVRVSGSSIPNQTMPPWKLALAETHVVLETNTSLEQHGLTSLSSTLQVRGVGFVQTVSSSSRTYPTASLLRTSAGCLKLTVSSGASSFLPQAPSQSRSSYARMKAGAVAYCRLGNPIIYLET